MDGKTANKVAFKVILPLCEKMLKAFKDKKKNDDLINSFNNGFIQASQATGLFPTWETIRALERDEREKVNFRISLADVERISEFANKSFSLDVTTTSASEIPDNVGAEICGYASFYGLLKKNPLYFAQSLIDDSQNLKTTIYVIETE